VLAAILQSGDPERLYTALSLLVSAAAEGTPARGLVTFGALGALLADELPADDAPHVVAAEREPFARTLAELRATAAELEDCRLWACAAAVAATGADPEVVAARLDGVMSTPRFLREVAGAQLVVV
jgi:peroxiredoxin family protein